VTCRDRAEARAGTCHVESWSVRKIVWRPVARRRCTSATDGLPSSTTGVLCVRLTTVARTRAARYQKDSARTASSPALGMGLGFVSVTVWGSVHRPIGDCKPIPYRLRTESLPSKLTTSEMSVVGRKLYGQRPESVASSTCGIPCASATARCTICPAAMFTPLASAGFCSAASRHPRFATSRAYASVAFVSA